MLSKCLGVEIPVEVTKVETNKITIQIENAFSGKILLYLRFNKNDTIKEMKDQVKKNFENKQDKTLYDFHVYNETREEITSDESDAIETLFKEDDYPVLAVSFKTWNILIEVLWQIILEDGKVHDFESNLIRRLAGLLYISDVECGKAKMRMLKKING